MNPADEHKNELSHADLERIMRGDTGWNWVATALIIAVFFAVAVLCHGCDQPRAHYVQPAPIVYDAPLAPPVVVQDRGLDVGDVLLMNALMNQGNTHTREVHYVDRPGTTPSTSSGQASPPRTLGQAASKSAAERVVFKPQPAPSAASRVQFKPASQPTRSTPSSASRVSFGSKTK